MEVILQGPYILLVQSGTGIATATPSVTDPALLTCPQLGKGSIFFVPAQTSLALTSQQGAPMVIWLAAVNSKVFSNRFSLPKVEQGVLQTV